LNSWNIFWSMGNRALRVNSYALEQYWSTHAMNIMALGLVGSFYIPNFLRWGNVIKGFNNFKNLFVTMRECVSTVTSLLPLTCRCFIEGHLRDGARVLVRFLTLEVAPFFVPHV
jgi:hypothetical protein